MMKFRFNIALLGVLLIATSCSNSNQKETILTVYHVNDVHGQMKNMAKIKHIITEKQKQNPTILVSAGDMFSGNPVVDNYEEQGYPMIDIMNHTGFTIAAIGNHEFDYGEATLSKRISQANFPWICANADFTNTSITNINPYQTIQMDEIKITVLGLVETEGMPNEVIPSTHPWDVKNTKFQKAKDILPKYEHLKQSENADIYLLLSHLGHSSATKDRIGDFEVAKQYPYFDAIIGGHTHRIIDTTINGISIFQAGSYLNYLGQIDFKIEGNKAKITHSQLIDLNTYKDKCVDLTKKIESYYFEMNPILDEVIGNSLAEHSKLEVGCFFTDALRNQMKADLVIQNTGGIRSKLNEGLITIREIYEIDPFNNGTIMYEMTIEEIKKFLKESQSGFYFSGLNVSQKADQIMITDLNGKQLDNDAIIKLGMNDYTAAVHHKFFPEKGYNFKKTSSKMLISYLKATKSGVNYSKCKKYFKYTKTN